MSSVSIPSISDAIEQVVADTEAALIADTSLDWGNLPKKLYFMHGHPKEIVMVLQAMTNAPATKDKKYPLFCLFRDVKEKLVEGQYGFDTAFNPRIVICTITKPEYRAEKRKEVNFDPILIPILAEFINQVKMSAVFNAPTLKDLDITKWDRYFWGSDLAGKNPLNDYIDAVEIESIKLKLNNICQPA